MSMNLKTFLSPQKSMRIPSISGLLGSPNRTLYKNMKNNLNRRPLLHWVLIIMVGLCVLTHFYGYNPLRRYLFPDEYEQARSAEALIPLAKELLSGNYILWRNNQSSEGNIAMRNLSRIIYNRPYLDFRVPNQAHLLIPALQMCDNPVLIYAWYFMTSQNGDRIRIAVRTVKYWMINRGCPWFRWNSACIFSPFYLQGNLPYPKELRDGSLTLAKIVLSTSKKTLSPSDTSAVTLGDPISMRPVENNKYKYQLAVCVPPLYLFGDWIQLVQFIEIWRMLGAEKFAIYETSITKEVNDWLSAYEKEGLVERYLWPLLPKSEDINPNLMVYRFGYNLATFDCVFRFSGVARYLALLDLDEFIIPIGHNDLHRYLRTLDKHKKAAAFTIRHRLLGYHTLPPAQVTVSDFDFGHLRDVFRFHPGSGPGKLLVRPDRTLHTTIHSIQKVLPGYKTLVPKDSNLYHLRRFPLGNSVKDWRAGFKRLIPFQSKVAGNFSRMMRSHFPGVNHMDSGIKWLDITHNCINNGMRAIKGKQNPKVCTKVPHYFCKSLLKKNAIEWIVHENPGPKDGFVVLY